MPYHNDTARTVAAAAYRRHHGNIKLAVAEFQQEAAGLAKQITRLDRFVKRWGSRLQNEGNIQTKAKPGRPHKIPAEILQQCTKAFIQGFKVNGRFRPFTSIKQAWKKCEMVRNTCEQYNTKPRGLLRMMKAKHKSLRKIRKRMRSPFTAEQKTARMNIAARLYNKPTETLNRVFFIDAKKIHVLPKDMAVWVDAKQDEFVLEDRRAPASSTAGVTLQFYAMVNAVAGPVAFAFTTGTSGLAGFKQNNYTVRPHFSPFNLWREMKATTAIVVDLQLHNTPKTSLARTHMPMHLCSAI
jgi:hypothetical protein